jgi:nicotinamide riboside transporter PnuC
LDVIFGLLDSGLLLLGWCIFAVKQGLALFTDAVLSELQELDADRALTAQLAEAFWLWTVRDLGGVPIWVLAVLLGTDILHQPGVLASLELRIPALICVVLFTRADGLVDHVR